MKLISTHSCFLFLFFSLPLPAVQFRCLRTDAGEEIILTFHSEVPSLIEQRGDSTQELLGPNGACNQVFAYSSQCQIHLLQQEEEYSYAFRCENVFGDLYFTSSNEGAAQFRCFGENVPSSYHDRIYRRCRVVTQ